MLEHIKFITLIQAMLTDKTESDDIKKLNDLLAQYGYLINPQTKRKRDDFAKRASKTMDSDFQGLENFLKGIK